MIEKTELKGKAVSYYDKEGRNRIDRVVRITGSWVTTKDAIGRRRRIHKDKILGVYRKRSYTKKGLEEIAW